MILLIDNYDSFTYNLYQQLEGLGAKTKVIEHDKITIKEIEELSPNKIVISPGPKTPQESGISMITIKEFHKSIPILGVCLGHECIGEIFGSKVIEAKEILHGKTSKVFHEEKGLFKGLKKPFLAARYHSLSLDSIPQDFELTAWDKNKEIMGMQHKEHPLYGIQFHPEYPEDPLTFRDGTILLENYINML